MPNKIEPAARPLSHAHPEVVLDIVIDDGLSDIIAGQCDAGIRVGERLEKDMIPVRLTPDVEMRALASPSTSLAAVSLGHPPIYTTMPASTGVFPGSGRIYRWQF